MMGNRITRCFRHGLAMNLAAPPRNPTISIVGGVNAANQHVAATPVSLGVGGVDNAVLHTKLYAVFGHYFFHVSLSLCYLLFLIVCNSQVLATKPYAWMRTPSAANICSRILVVSVSRPLMPPYFSRTIVNASLMSATPRWHTPSSRISLLSCSQYDVLSEANIVLPLIFSITPEPDSYLITSTQMSPFMFC